MYIRSKELKLGLYVKLQFSHRSKVIPNCANVKQEGRTDRMCLALEQKIVQGEKSEAIS